MIEWLPFGWRDGILLLVAVAAIYLVVMLLKLVQLGRRQSMPADPAMERQEAASSYLQRGGEALAATGANAMAASAVAAQTYAEEAQEEPSPGSFAVPPAADYEWSEVEELLRDVAEHHSVPGLATPGRPPGFGEHLADHLARSNVEMEVQRMRDEMERMRVELEEMRVARRVSPQYAEAMELSQRGLSAQDVADRLNISLAEAELVHALSRSEAGINEGD